MIKSKSSYPTISDSRRKDFCPSFKVYTFVSSKADMTNILVVLFYREVNSVCSQSTGCDYHHILQLCFKGRMW